MIVQIENSFCHVLGIFIFNKSKATVLASGIIQRYVHIHKLYRNTSQCQTEWMPLSAFQRPHLHPALQHIMSSCPAWPWCATQSSSEMQRSSLVTTHIAGLQGVSLTLTLQVLKMRAYPRIGQKWAKTIKIRHIWIPRIELGIFRV